MTNPHAGTRIISTDGGPVTICAGPYPGTPVLIINPNGTVTDGAGNALSFGTAVTNPLGGDLSAGSHKITALASGAAGTDAANVSQLPTAAEKVPASPNDATQVLLGSNPPAFGPSPGGGGGGDFKADGSVPATGDFDMAQNGIEGVKYIALTGTDPAYTSTFLEVNDGYNLTLGFDTHVPSNAAAVENTYLGSEAGHGHGANAYSGCTAVGANALRNNSFGQENTMIGRSAMVSGSGPWNTGVGSYCFGNAITNVSGFDNSGLGHQAFPALTSGARNVAIGKLAGSVLANGGRNVFVGESTTAGAAALTGAIVIGAGAVSAGDNSIVIGAAGASAPAMISASGAPVDGSHPDGSYYFRQDDVGGTTNIYKARSGVWVALI